LYLFDTNAISESLRPRPNREFVTWIESLAPESQFTSIVVIAELYAGAYRSRDPSKWLQRLEQEVFPRLRILDFDIECARVYGQIYAELARAGTPIGDIDTEIAATALRHDLVLATANVKHFQRVSGLALWSFTPGDETSSQ